MELIFNVFAYAMDSLDSGTILNLLVITLSFAVYIVVSRKKYERAHYPPLAPGGMFHHVKMVTSAQYPWWLLVGIMTHAVRAENEEGISLAFYYFF